MGRMKELDIRIYGGGEDAIAAACELAGIVKERRGYDDIMKATGDITDIVTVLRGLGFSAVSPDAGDSASLLYHCATHAADEIERLRLEGQAAKIARDVVTLTDADREAAGATQMSICTREAYEGDIVSRLRNWRGLHLAHGGDLFEEAADEIVHLRLTDAERRAVSRAARDASDFGYADTAATLRSLLKRIGGEQ